MLIPARLRGHLPKLLLLVPTILTASWHVSNLRLPDGDAAGYVETSIRIFRTFNVDGFVSGTKALVLTRGFRPSMWPIWEALALILAKGHLYQSIGLVLSIFMLLFSCYAYLILKLYIPTNRAILGSLFLSTMPWVAEYSYIYYSELACIVFALGFGYHYIQSDGFCRHGHAIGSGIYLALLLCTRPDLGPAISLPLILVVLAERHRQLLTIRDILAAGALAIALTVEASYIGISNRIPPQSALIIMGLSVCAYLAYMLAKRKSISMGFLLFVASATSMSTAWFGGFLREFYYWGYAACCSIPFDVRSESQLDNVIVVVRGSLHHYGTLQIFLLSLLLAIAIAPQLGRLRFEKFLDGVLTPGSRFFPIVIGLAAAPPMVAALLVAGTTEQRRLMVPAVFLFVGIIAVLLRGNGTKSNLGMAAIGLFVLLQIHNLLNNTFGPWQNPISPLQAYSGDLRRPQKEPDTDWDFMKTISERGITEGQMAVYTFTMYQFGAQVYDPATLSMLAARETPRLSIGYLWDPPNLNAALSQLRQLGFQYVVLDVFPSSTAWNVDKPYIEVARELTNAYLNFKVENFGLREIFNFKLKGRSQVVFRIGDPKAPSTDRSWRGYGVRAGASSEESTFPAENLNDGKTETAWGALSNSEDVYAYVTLATPMTNPKLKLLLFSPGGRNHLNEIRIVARNEWNGPWTFIRSRVSGAQNYSEKITIPPGNDGATVSIELDPSDTSGKAYQTYGIACLRQSKSDVPNYLGKAGTGVYLRELVIEK